VQRVTALKLRAALARLRRRGLPPAPVLCADTTVVLGRRILGKPADDQEAREMLQSLSGRSHRVLTAVALGYGGRRLTALSRSRVRFSAVEAAALAAYVDSGEPRGKAGAYAIQSSAACWIVHIEGSHSGIMGLPLHETAALLRAMQVRF
jgi:septum formation protein